MIFKKKKEMSLEEQIERQRKNLKKVRVINVLKVIFLTLGAFGGISYLSQPEKDTNVNQDVLIENRAISYVRDYYAKDDDILVNAISVTDISGEKTKKVELAFVLNEMQVTTEVNLDSSLNPLNEIVVSPAAEAEVLKKTVKLDTVKNLDDKTEKETTQFAESYFSALNSNNATIFYDKAPALSEFTQYDLDTLVLKDSGETNENLTDMYVSIDYVFYNKEKEEIFRENQDVEIVFNQDSKIIDKVEY